jgi:putative addiction module component (TIGR02574 family)
MRSAVEEVVQRALKLDEEERAEVASRVLASLEEGDAAAEAAWDAELERRANEMESGAVEGIPWEDLREKLMRGRRGA